MKKTEWTYDLFARKFDARIKHPRTYEEAEALFNATMLECSEDLPQVRAALFDAYYPVLALNAVRLAVDAPQAALASLHLIWRLKAISLSAYLEYVDRRFLQKARPRVRPIGFHDVNDLLSLAASAGVFGVDDAAQLFAKKTFQLERESSPKVDRRSFCSGPVEPFLFNLCAKRYRHGKNLAIQTSEASWVFSGIEHQWETSGITSAINELLSLKSSKMLSSNANDDLVFGLSTGVNFLVPFEVLFIKRVRESTGLPTPLPSHALLDLPVCREIRECSESGANSHIARVLSVCQELLPGFSIPWEERFSELPSTEFEDILA